MIHKLAKFIFITLTLLLLTTLAVFYVTSKPIPTPSQKIQNQQQKTEKQTPPNTSLQWTVQDKPVKIPILMYHAIHTMAPEESHNANLIISPDLFEEHVKALTEDGYYFLTPEEAYRALSTNQLPQKKVVWLTFDDSLWDFYQFAYPIMRKYQVTATNNVITGFTEENGYQGHLSLEQMLEMKENGFSFQSHTVTHPDLSLLTPLAQEHELSQAKADLDEQLTQDTITITYPAGRYNDVTLQFGQSYYKLGLTTNEGLASINDGLLSLKRVRILPSTSADSLLDYIASANP